MALTVADWSVLSVGVGAVCCYLFYTFIISLYRIYLHPLSRYPGPTLWAISRFPRIYHVIKGTTPYKTLELHNRYGPIVRLSSNELSFILEDAWQDIYGKPSSRGTQLKKDNSQFIPPDNGVPGMIVTQDDEAHARMRRNWSHGFAEKALRDQQAMVKAYVDLLIQRFHENSKEPIDVVKWFNSTTFDIIGDLTFGEPFGCLDKSEIHFWVQNIFVTIKSILFLSFLGRYGLVKIVFALAPKRVKDKKQQHGDFIEAKLMKRLESSNSRPDFLSLTQTQLNQPQGMTFDELISTMGDIVFAGSETTATLLSGVTYYIAANPSVHAKIAHEVRSAFRTEDDIHGASVNSLTYMLAVINETLRIYPPTPASFKRLTPPEGCMIAGHFVPGNTTVAVNQWSANHSTLNFARPWDFVPERWMGDPEFKDDKKKACQPFSVGPRNCIGRNLAYAEARFILARLVWNFDIALEGDKGWSENQGIFLVYEKPALMVRLKPVTRD